MISRGKDIEKSARSRQKLEDSRANRVSGRTRTITVRIFKGNIQAWITFGRNRLQFMLNRKITFHNKLPWQHLH